MLEIGRVVTKTRGKEAGKVAVIVDILEGKMVMFDGNVKRKQCSIHHIEPMTQTLEIKKGASTEEVKKGLEKLNLLNIPKKRKAFQKRDRKGGKRPVKTKKKKAPAKKKAKKMTEDEKVEADLAKV